MLSAAEKICGWHLLHQSSLPTKENTLQNTLSYPLKRIQTITKTQHTINPQELALQQNLVSTHQGIITKNDLCPPTNTQTNMIFSILFKILTTNNHTLFLLTNNSSTIIYELISQQASEHRPTPLQKQLITTTQRPLCLQRLHLLLNHRHS